MKIIGGILAGGMSIRMQSEKGLLLAQNSTFVEKINNILSPLVKDVFISTNIHNDQNYKKLGLKTVTDTLFDKGPLGGIYSIMKKKPADFYLIVSCDTPNITETLLTKLLNNSITNQCISICQDTYKTHPLIGCYPNLTDSLKENIDQKKLGVMKWIATQKHDILVTDTVQNINTPNDYKEIIWES